jgi:hypothetical protein
MNQRMNISLHLFPSLPLWVSFFFYGLCMGGVWHWWKSGNRGCLLIILFWYAFAVAVVFWWASLSVQPYDIWAAFFAGVCITYVRRIWEHETTQDTLYFFGRTWRFCVDMAERFKRWNRSRRERGASSNEEPPRQNTSHPHEGAGHGNTDRGHDEAMRQEQSRREAEARARRGQAERERQEQTRRNEPPPTQDNRSYTEILGLKDGWTQEDLKTAYRRECQRLHPDKWSGKPNAIRAILEAEYKMVQKAYHALKT